MLRLLLVTTVVAAAVSCSSPPSPVGEWEAGSRLRFVFRSDHSFTMSPAGAGSWEQDGFSVLLHPDKSGLFLYIITGTAALSKPVPLAMSADGSRLFLRVNAGAHPAEVTLRRVGARPR